MKKRLLFLCAGMLMLAGSAFARPVDANKARTVAETYLRAMGMKNPSALVDVTAQTPFTEFYIFAAEEGGFILVSADDCARPVLGYSTTSKFKTKNIPANVRWWLEGYEKEIRHGKSQVAAQSLPMADMETESQWQMLTSGQMLSDPLNTAVAPLLATTWNQYPYYNSLCPYDERETYTPDGRIVTGCVATATAQIMKYHNYPTTGYGSHSYVHYNDDTSYGTLSANFGNTTYQWSNMPNALTSTSSTAQVNAVATLMYHIGVADEMEYDLGANGGSGAFNYNYNGTLTASSQTSLMEYFKYRPDMRAVIRDNYSHDEYCALLRAELDQSRPILYSGRGSGGHSFVCDGYDNAGDFHINWGWGGAYDGYFTVDAFMPGGGGAGSSSDHNYSHDNVALLGIQPNTNWSTTGTTTVTTAVSGATGITVNGAGTYSFGDTVELSVINLPEGYRFARWSDGDRFNPREIYANGGNYSLTAMVEPLSGDTLSYCGQYASHLTSYSVDWADNRWGIRLPASVLTAGTVLDAVQIYIKYAGTYTLTVYTGTTDPTTEAYSASTTFYADDEEAWQTIALSTPVAIDGTQNVWITFTNTDVDYPAAVTASCGNVDGLIFGNSLDGYNDYTFMIRGIFSEQTVSPVDENCVIQYFPYTQDFDGTLVSCWNIYDQNQDGTIWAWYNSVGIDGSSCLGMNTQNGGNDLTFAPLIATPGNYTISWKASAYWAPSRNETYLVVKLGNEGIDTIFSEVLSSSEYVDRNASFTVAQGDTVRIGFWAITDTGGYFLIDDVTIDVASQQPVVSTFPWSEGFNDTVFPEGFAFVDSDADGFNWTMSQNLGSLYVHEGMGCITSASYDHINGAALSPDNWMILPAFALPASATDFTLSWWVRGQDNGNYAAEYYSVYVTTVGSSVSNFTATTPIYAGYSTSQYVKQTVNLGSYAGQTIYVAFRHHNVSDMYYLNIDEMRIGAPEAPEVNVSGPAAIAMGSVATYTATAPTATSFSWYVDGVQQAGSGNVFTTTFSTAGNHTVRVGATNVGGTSYDTVVTLAYNAADAVARHALIEEFATAQTIYTPGATTRIQNAIAGQENNVVWVTHHVGYFTDDLTITESNQILDLFGTGGTWAPAMAIDRSAEYVEGADPSGVVGSVSSPYSTITTNLTAALAAPSFVSVNLSNIDFNATTRQLTLTASGNVNQFGGTQLRLSVYLIEDSVVGTQNNTTDTIYDYVHNHVIRAAISNIWGDADAFTGTTGAYSKTYTYTLPTTLNAAHCRVVAFVNDYGADMLHRKVLNATQSEYLSVSQAPQTYTITTNANNPAWGTVTGGGTYSEGDNAMLTAIANSGYQFAYWSDGSIDNPHYLEVTSDTTIVAVFTTQRPATVGDTVSYCDNDEFYTNMGAGGNIHWGIMLPASNLTGRNYLKSVMLYVAAQGTYNMNIYTGGTDAPGTLLHSQTVVFGEEQTGWQEILLDATCAIGGQNLWITFHNSGVNYPADGCYYVGSANSDWVSLDGTSWNHLAGYYGFNVTWMIKAVTSATQPTLPAPSVAVSGSVQVGVGATAYFSAIHTDGVTPSWTLTGATPATATGDTVMATWNVAGYYNVIATVSNTYGTTRDTLTIHVVDYGAGDTVSYVLDRPFLTKVGTGSSRAFSWGIMVPADYMANRRQVNKVLVGLKEPGSYSVRIFQGGDYAPQTLVYSDIFSITSADTAQTYYNYVPANPIAVSNNSNLWVVFHAENLAYPAASTRHTTESNSDWVSLNDTNWYHLPQLGVNASWMIKVVTSADSVAPIELYTVTATANNPAWGTVTGSGTYTAGSSIALTATPNSGYHFAQWLDGSMQNPRIVTVSSDTSFVAVFEVDGANPPTGDTCAITQFPYVMDFENGAPCWSLRDNNQNDTTWGIIDNYGYNGSTCAFAHYQLQADDWLMSPRVAMTGNYSVSWKVRAMHPSFPETYQVWAMGNDTSIMIFSETLSDTLYQDRMATFTVPAGDSVLIMWRYISADMYVLFLDNVTISQGTQQQFTVTATSNNPAWGTVTGGGTYPSGSTATLMAIANSGYHFVEWQDGNTQNPLTITVTSNATYTATFAADSPNPPTGDTISYCLNNPIATAINAGGASFDWGIMFPASSLTDRNYLKSVLTYVLSDETYTLRVFRGGDNMPATLVHTQSVSFDTNHLGWQEIALDATVSLPTGQNLWVVLNSTVAAVCNYTGDVNSDWLGFSDSNWIHLYEANASLTYSWLLKAVTSATQPALPAPSVSISGPTQIAMGTAATFMATGTAGAVITWNFQGGTPAVATGTSATTTFTTPGLHNVVATITNAYGTGRDTLQVLVVDYAAGDTVSYCLDREFFTNIGTGSPAPFSWGIMLPAAYLVHRDKLDHVLLYTKVPGDYTLRLYQGGDTVPQNLIHTQVFNITDTNSGYKTLTPNTTINIDKTLNLWIVFHTDSLSYAAAAGAYTGDINSSWITLNDTNWNQLSDYGLVYSWLIKVVTSQEGPVTHNVTVVSIMNDGTELDPAVCTVTGADSYAEGSTVTLTAASSDPAIEFLFWITPSGDTILDNPYIFPIHSDVTLIAVFGHTEGISGIRNVSCSIYPNPAHDFVVIDGVEGQARVTITDITGREVARFEVRNERTEFDVSRLGAGQYFIRIVGNGINTVKKLIVE